MSKNEQKSKKPIYKRVWFWVLVVIIIGSAAQGMGGSDDKDSASASKDKVEQSSSEKKVEKPAESSSKKEEKKSEKPKETATPVTFQQMVNDYLANGVTADEKYKDKLLEFQGKVKKITSGTFGGSDVEIEAGNFTDNQFMDTTAIVNVSDATAKTLVAGQTYTFVAKGSSAMILDSYVSHINFTDGKVK